jgi:sulfur-oxidizing protein SoxY
MPWKRATTLNFLALAAQLTMNLERREFLWLGARQGMVLGLLCSGLLRAERVEAAQSRAGFDTPSLAEVLRNLDASPAHESREVLLKAPDIAENAASVMVEVISNVPNTESISLVVDKNPFPLAARFRFSPQALPQVEMRLKLAQTSVIRAIVRAGGKTWQVSREVKVTLGGCSA